VLLLTVRNRRSFDPLMLHAWALPAFALYLTKSFLPAASGAVVVRRRALASRRATAAGVLIGCEAASGNGEAGCVSP
jgi:hypothetical protein